MILASLALGLREYPNSKGPSKGPGKGSRTRKAFGLCSPIYSVKLVVNVSRRATASLDYPFWDPHPWYHEITVRPCASRQNSKSKGKTSVSCHFQVHSCLWWRKFCISFFQITGMRLIYAKFVTDLDLYNVGQQKIYANSEIYK